MANIGINININNLMEGLFSNYLRHLSMIPFVIIKRFVIDESWTLRALEGRC